MSGYTLHIELAADTLDGALREAQLVATAEYDAPDWTLTRDGDWSEHAPGSPDYNPGLHGRVGDPDPTVKPETRFEACPATKGSLYIYCCTREKGHDGQHIAGDGTTVVATWWDKR